MKQIIDRISNGHVLKLSIDADELIMAINNQIKNVRDNTDENGIAEYLTTVQGRSDDAVLAEDVIKDLEKMKLTVQHYAEEENHFALIDKMPLKKNGTFKRTQKPVLAEAEYGEYWDDSYGWYVMVIRIEATSDTEAEVRADFIIEHY